MASSNIKPFTTDGCSGGMTWLWLKLRRRPPPWNDACVDHDRAYWMGGTRAMRRNADLMLCSQVVLNGHPFWALAMWMAVRLGGHPAFPFSWRWGYGYDWPRPYDKL